MRTELNATSQRRMAVLDPIRLVLTNWPEGAVEHFSLTNNPESPDDGTRDVAFTGELWIEREDFMAEPAPKYFRLFPGNEVRLRGAYLVTCTGYDADADGRVTTVYATYDPASKGGSAPDGRKVKSTMHWVSAADAVPVTAALYERLYTTEVPGERTGDPLDDINPDSRELRSGWGEAALADTPPGAAVQFERLGYFAHDPREPGLYHRTVGLKDEWANLQKRQS